MKLEILARKKKRTSNFKKVAKNLRKIVSVINKKNGSFCKRVFEESGFARVNREE